MGKLVRWWGRWREALSLTRCLAQIDWQDMDIWMAEHNSQMLGLNMKTQSTKWGMIIVIGEREKLASIVPQE